MKRKAFELLRAAANRAPLLKKSAKSVLKHFPGLENRIRRSIHGGVAATGPQLPPPGVLADAVGFRLSGEENVVYYYAEHTANFNGNTGVQRVVRMLAGAWLKQGVKLRFVKWSDEADNLVYLSNEEIAALASFNGPDTAIISASFDYAKIGGEIVPAHADAAGNWLVIPEVTWLTSCRIQPARKLLRAAAIRRLRTAWIFYDAIPLHNPELRCCAPQHAEYMRLLARADLIIPISHTSEKELREFWRLSGISSTALIRTLKLPACNLAGYERAEKTAAAEQPPFILCAGNIAKHKNQMALCRAFSDFCAANAETPWQLVFVGLLSGELAAEFNRHMAENPRIKYAGAVPDAELAALYSRCAFTAFPSVEEGYGLPIVESLWFGKPCLCAGFGAMGELAAAGGCLAVDTRSDADIRAGIEKLTGNPELLTELSGEALKVKLSKWPEYASEFSAALATCPAARVRGPNGKKRIFWFGMHKILVPTELARLRKLGYEVFNPPYLSTDFPDQSAEPLWNYTQETTLPQEVFDRLSTFNFFFNPVSGEIAALLNEYFDTVIVTIHPYWLESMLSSFGGRIIYRTYGTPWLLSASFQPETLAKLAARKDMFFVPTSFKGLAGNPKFKGEVYFNDYNGKRSRENNWFIDNAIEIPYCLTDEIFGYAGKWVSSKDKTEIAVTCPNVDNPYYAWEFQYLKKEFAEPFYRYYGVQLREHGDPNIVGTLSRGEFIRRFLNSAGYLYTYKEPWTCYLPPIEMMVLGGPVLFFEGSLLDSLAPPDAPGRCRDENEAREKVRRLREHDTDFIKAVIDSQRDIVKLYTPDYVWPIFDAEMRKIIG